MSFESERQYLETRFVDNWTYTPIKWANTHFVTSGQTEFVALTIVQNDAEQAQIGSVQHVYRKYAFLVTQVFIKPNIGSRRAYELADYVVDIWRTFSYSYVTIQDPEIVEIGVNKGWFQIDVIHPFYRNEFGFTPSYAKSFDLGFDTGFA